MWYCLRKLRGTKKVKGMASEYYYVLENSDVGDLSFSQEHVGPNSEPSFSTAPYLDPRKNRCSGKGNTCQAYSIKSTRNTPAPVCAGCVKIADSGPTGETS